MQAKYIVDGVAGLMPQDPHAFAFAGPFHFDHLRTLQLHQSRMGQIERNRKASDPVRSKPLFRKPGMRTEGQTPGVQLSIQLFNPLF